MVTPATSRHRAGLDRLADRVEADILAATSSAAAGAGDIDRWWRRNRSGLLDIVAAGVEIGQALGVDYLLTGAAALGLAGGVDVVLAGANLAQIATSLFVTGPVALKQNMRNTGDAGVAVQTMRHRLAAAGARHSLNGARLTVEATAYASAKGSGVIIGYRRVAQAGACDFCEMLAGRGAVYLSREKAGTASGTRGTRKPGASYHDNCRCTVEPIYDDGRVADPTPPPPVVEPVADPTPEPTPPEPVAVATPTDKAVQARDAYRAGVDPPKDKWSTLDAKGNNVPTPEMFEREKQRHNVGAAADDAIAARLDAKGVRSPDQIRADIADARRRRDDAAARFQAANRGTKAERKAAADLTAAENDIMSLQSDLHHATGDYRRAWQSEMRALMDDMGIARGGVPARDLVSNYDYVEAGLRARIDTALDQYPTDWLRRSTGADSFEVVHVDPRAYMRGKWLGQQAQMNLNRNQQVDVIVHEFGHQCENLSPDIRRSEWAFYWRRCAGEDERRLDQVYPGSGYRADEKSRTDQWPDAYIGKPYQGATMASNYEVWTMAAQWYLTPTSPLQNLTDDKFWDDADYRQWFLGTLLTG